jgi:alcohol dehydrogenase (cytochrome c)
MKITAIAIVALAVMPLAGQGLPVTYERLVKADQEPGNWLTYSNSYNSWRFSRLDQINTQTVKNLQVKWLFQGRHQEKFETTPLVVDGIMYLTRPENDVYALDADWSRLWTYSYKNSSDLQLLWPRNRGLAIMGNRLHEHARHARLPSTPSRAVSCGRPKSRLHRRADTLPRRAARREGQGDRRHGRREHLSRLPMPTMPPPASNCGATPFLSPANRTSVPARDRKPAASPPEQRLYDPETNTVYWAPQSLAGLQRRFRAGEKLYSCSILALDATRES